MLSRRLIHPLFPAITLVLLLMISGLAHPERAASQPRGTAQARPVIPCPPRPFPPPPGCATPAADIILCLLVEPSGAVPPASIVTYQLAARNSGRGDATDIRVTLPFASDVQAPLDAMFSDSGAWVTAVLTDAIELRLDALKRDQTITTTLRLRISPIAPIGHDLTTRARLRWSGLDGGNMRLSNRAPLIVAQRAADHQPVSLVIAPPTGVPTTTFAATYDGFASHERVSLWYHRISGASVSLGETRADTQGRIAYSLPAAGLTEGNYTLVVYGQCSQVSAVGTFAVMAVQPTAP
jgi:hypothetical protein